MPQQTEAENSARVIYSGKQVEVMETCANVLVAYFNGIRNGRAIYDERGCQTPTMAEASAAAEMLAVAVGAPIPPSGYRAHATTQADNTSAETHAR